MTDYDNNPETRPAVLKQKTVGVMVPLFSIRTAQNAGVGEILDLIPFIDWMTRHGIRLVQILPIYETAPAETSPYQALSSFAIDPLYLSISDTEGFCVDREVSDYLETESVSSNLSHWRSKKTVDVKPIRALKYAVLQLAFERYKTDVWNQKGEGATQFQDFIKAQSAWLYDYALFWQMKKKQGWRHWHDWPDAYKHRDPEALALFEKEEADAILFIQYVQWILWSQWQSVRAHAKTQKSMIMGDMPFLVSRDSADVWRNQHLFDQVVSVGAPPDNFNADGQDWGLPVFSWKAMETDHFNWWRLRMRHASQCYDLIRLDHVVGFFRIWVMPKGASPYFEPAHETEQFGRGRFLLRVILSELGECIPIAEDLGCVPDFVRQVLSDLHIAGHKVLRWEKEGTHYHAPKDYPFLSMATTGTHDTSSLSKWWNALSEEEQASFLDLLNHTEGLTTPSRYSPRLHEAIFDLMMASGAGLVIFPIHDILSESAQINAPGTVGPENWCYRMPLPLSELNESPPYGKQLSYFKSAVERFSRDLLSHA